MATDMTLSPGLGFLALRTFDERPLDDCPQEAKRLTTILEAQDERLPRETPRHPIRKLQGALEESLVENADPQKGRWPAVPSQMVDSATRRRILLQQIDADEAYVTRWRQKPDERFHPLTKLIAQISYGVHLLHKGLVQSDSDVIRILQTYVAEVDSFLEQTTEDFDLAISDIEERIKCLRLPLEHDEIFDAMLEDRAFRKQIVDGNEKIEHIINRTEAAMNDALDDVQQALDATKELAKYLVRLDRKWPLRTEDQDEVYAAMGGNSEGWFRCLFGIQTKGHSLSSMMLQLGAVVSELQRRAGEASRKNIAVLTGGDGRRAASTEHSPSLTSSPRIDKPLPRNSDHDAALIHRGQVSEQNLLEASEKRLPVPNSDVPMESPVLPKRSLSNRNSRIDERSAPGQGVFEGRGTASRASGRVQAGLQRSQSLRESRRQNRDDCPCPYAADDQGLSCRSSLIRESPLPGKASIEAEIVQEVMVSPSPPGTANSSTSATPKVAFHRPVSDEELIDSAYSSGESVMYVSSPEPDRMCSPSPTFTSDLYLSSLPSSRLMDGKAAAIMGLSAANGTARRQHRDLRSGRMDSSRTPLHCLPRPVTPTSLVPSARSYASSITSLARPASSPPTASRGNYHSQVSTYENTSKAKNKIIMMMMGSNLKSTPAAATTSSASPKVEAVGKEDGRSSRHGAAEGRMRSAPTAAALRQHQPQRQQQQPPSPRRERWMAKLSRTLFKRTKN